MNGLVSALMSDATQEPRGHPGLGPLLRECIEHNPGRFV